MFFTLLRNDFARGRTLPRGEFRLYCTHVEYLSYFILQQNCFIPCSFFFLLVFVYFCTTLTRLLFRERPTDVVDLHRIICLANHYYILSPLLVYLLACEYYNSLLRCDTEKSRRLIRYYDIIFFRPTEPVMLLWYGARGVGRISIGWLYHSNTSCNVVRIKWRRRRRR